MLLCKVKTPCQLNTHMQLLFTVPMPASDSNLIWPLADSLLFKQGVLVNP